MDNELKAAINRVIASAKELGTIVYRKVEKDEATWQAIQSAGYNVDELEKMLVSCVDYKTLYQNEMKRGLEP